MLEWREVEILSMNFTCAPCPDAPCMSVATRCPRFMFGLLLPLPSVQITALPERKAGDGMEDAGRVFGSIWLWSSRRDGQDSINQHLEAQQVGTATNHNSGNFIFCSSLPMF